MNTIKKLEKKNKCVVYDISADGTFVNALGMNVLHNTDGFNFKLPTGDFKIAPTINEAIVPCDEGETSVFNGDIKLYVKYKNNEVKLETIENILANNIQSEDIYILINNKWVNKNELEFIEL